jgi:RNA polymerase sigma-70 factor (ECF subfamily)
MAQGAFLRAYRSLERWRREAAFSTWLFALATKLYCSEIRRIPARMVPLEQAPEPRDPRATAEGLMDAERDHIVRRAILGLPAKYREVLILFYFHDMNVPAAAESLGLPEGTVKARLSRGRGILCNKLPRLLERRSSKEGQ